VFKRVPSKSRITWEISREKGLGAAIPSTDEFNAVRYKLFGRHNLTNSRTIQA
jgi:hypothetical protein